MNTLRWLFNGAFNPNQPSSTGIRHAIRAYQWWRDNPDNSRWSAIRKVIEMEWWSWKNERKHLF